MRNSKSIILASTFLVLILLSAFDYKQISGLETVVSSIDSETPSLIVRKDSLELRRNEGLVYFQSKIFTGVSVGFYPSGVKSEEISYLKGKKSGFYKKWYESGVLSFEANYSEGKLHGTSKTWWRNEKLRSQAFFHNGIGEGLQKQWYTSGAIFKEIHLKSGREEGLQKAWRENGKIYNNYEAKNGRIFGLKRANLCFQLEAEEVIYED
ncbi:MAG: antitoxin component YwqK of YwqJK toxin-antitoxin module [Arenicella sp.]|jgi:antitoxin component YwqK of YwqJK toxin-antitoxin module